MRHTTRAMAVLAAGVVVLAGCGDDDGDDAGGTGSAASTATSSESPESSAPAADEAALTTGDTDLGTIVTDAEGMTVYVFDRDTPGSGESACTGQCLVAWPPVLTESDSPAADGVSGDVGTITRDDGTMQVTLDGYPLYYWQDDAEPGDTTGQGVQGVWWVVGSDGAKITEAAAPASIDGY
jgi:predicted lipoprotein with Yx(FWY)xxD motif